VYKVLNAKLSETLQLKLSKVDERQLEALSEDEMKAIEGLNVVEFVEEFYIEIEA